MPKRPPKYDPLGRTPQQRRSRYDALRGSATERGYDGRWQRYSTWFRSLPENVLCACGCGRPTQGKRGCVDHIIACEPTDARFWDMRNHQALTNRCHGTKTRRFDDPRQRRGTQAELQRMLDAARVRAEAIEKRVSGGGFEANGTPLDGDHPRVGGSFFLAPAPLVDHGYTVREFWLVLVLAFFWA